MAGVFLLMSNWIIWNHVILLGLPIIIIKVIGLVSLRYLNLAYFSLLQAAAAVTTAQLTLETTMAVTGHQLRLTRPIPIVSPLRAALSIWTLSKDPRMLALSVASRNNKSYFYPQTCRFENKFWPPNRLFTQVRSWFLEISRNQLFSQLMKSIMRRTAVWNILFLIIQNFFDFGL